MPMMPLWIRLALIALVGTAAVYDFRTRRIPNWLNLCGLIAGFGLNLYFFQGVGALRAGEGMLLAAAIYLPLYLLRGMGAGDVKLMAAIGSLAGPSNWMAIFIATSLVGGIVAAGLAFQKGRLNQTLGNVVCLIGDLARFRAPYRENPELDFRNPHSLRLPHGVLIAIGSAFVLALSFRDARSLLPNL